MCEPVTLALIAAGVSAVGTGFSAIQASQQAKYQSKVADRNADLANEAAQNEQQNTRMAALDHYRKQAQLKGQQRAALAANGVDLSFGNAADLQGDTEMLGNEDVTRLYAQGSQRARGFEVEASNFSGEAAAKRQASTGALIGGALNVGSTALSGASQYSYMKNKVGGS